MSAEKIQINRILERIRTRLDYQWEENFRRQGFFSEKWARTKRPSAHHTLLDSGHLRESLDSEISGTTITFYSDAPYANIHNDGGTLTVTAAMKRAFWALSYRATNAADKDYYKRLALMKVGKQLTIPRRRFLGDAPEVRKIVTETIDDELRKFFDNNIEFFVKK